jgi:hypothetical protein
LTKVDGYFFEKKFELFCLAYCLVFLYPLSLYQQKKQAMKNNRSQILSLAWQIRRTTSLTWSECQTAAWNAFKLREALKAGVTNFYFIKADGSLRKAVGTLDSTLFEYEAKGEAKPNPMLVRFWDLEKMAFRSCKIQNIFKIAA